MSGELKQKITKITADIARIEESFFTADKDDLGQRYFELQRKREHLLRSMILELHLATEDIITGAVGNALLRGRPIRSPVGQTIRDLLQDERSLGFLHKVMLARTLGIVTLAQFNDLIELNTVRNRCSHNWQLNRLIRRKLKPTKPKRPLLRWRGRNLYETDAFLDFIGYFTRHYLRLWLRHT